MKKIIFIFFVLVSFVGYSQQNFTIGQAKLEGMIYNTKSGAIDTLLTVNTDSLGQFLIKNVSDPQQPLDAVNFRTLLGYSGGSGGLDSLVFTPSTGSLEIYAGASVLIDENLDGRYILLQDSTSLWVTKKQLLDSIQSLENKIDMDTRQTIFSVVLPSSTTIAGRIALATEGIDYPTGWILSEGANPANIDINHGLNRKVASITVFYNVTGDEFRQLVSFNNAYSGVLAVNDNNLRIEGLTTIQKKLRIMITFE